NNKGDEWSSPLLCLYLIGFRYLSTTQFPISLPNSCPALQEKRKCIPAITLDSAFSFAASLILLKLLVIPAGCEVNEVMVNGVSSPAIFASTVAAALPKALWVEG